MKIGIVGYGTVGKHLAGVFHRAGYMVSILDACPQLPECYASREDINKSDLVFIAVPTPSLPNGDCDTAAVEEVVEWVSAPICIKSTIPPGTVTRLIARFGKRIVFSPEYVGETPFHTSTLSHIPDLVAVGGERTLCNLVVDVYRNALGPEPRYFTTDAVTAELAKYMENCFLATKVAFVAQFYLLASLFEADFTAMREIWTADTRVGRSHSTVIGDLGFGGKCLPKDLAAIIQQTQNRGGDAMFLQSVLEFNRAIRRSVCDSDVKSTGIAAHSPSEYCL